PQLAGRCFSLADPASPESSALSLHDALPILIDTDPAVVHVQRIPAAKALDVGVQARVAFSVDRRADQRANVFLLMLGRRANLLRSEEHTSELQSRENLVCRLLLEKKNNISHI